MKQWLSLALCAALLGGCASPAPGEQAQQHAGPQAMGGPPDEGAAVAASLGYHGPVDRQPSQRP